MAPIDLRIDHVYLVSCKYESDILANTSPGRLFEGLLATSGTWPRGNWYEQVAPAEFSELYTRSRPPPGSTTARGPRGVHPRSTAAPAGPGRPDLPDHAGRAAYAELCRAVSEASAGRWTAALQATGTGPEVMLWRLLRIGSAPYFVLGIGRRSASRSGSASPARGTGATSSSCWPSR